MLKAVIQFILLFSLSLAFALSVQAGGESPTRAQLRGRVLDPNRAALAGVKVTATRNDQLETAITNRDGDFSLLLEPGEYTLQISADGFAEASFTVRSQPATFEPIEVVLELASASASVTVTDMAGDTLAVNSATKTLTALRDVPQSIAVVSREAINDQGMQNIADVVRYIPGITAIQGENNRDQVVIRGNSSSADFFLDGVRDDVQYYRDLYNLDRVEVLKGPNAMIFGRGGGGGVINRVAKEAEFMPLREVTLDGGMYSDKRFATDLNQALSDKVAVRLNGMYENSDSFRNNVGLARYGINPTITYRPTKTTRITLGYEHFRDDRTADRGIPSFQGRPLDVPVSQFFGNP